MPRRTNTAVTGRARLESLVSEALKVAAKAKRHHLNLAGSNFYADKLVQLRADATNVFRDLSSATRGDVTAMAEMIERVFGPRTPSKDRRDTTRDLIFSLRTTWRDQPGATSSTPASFFPLSILESTGRGYLVSIGRQVNGCHGSGWHDASAVMMRRLLEIVIIEAFENNGIASKVKRRDGNYCDLSDLVQKALAEASWTLSRNTRRALPTLRDLGHMSAHGRYFSATMDDMENVRLPYRVVIEELLHHAKLLK